MELQAVRVLARSLMQEYGVTDMGWRFDFDQAKRRGGCAHFGSKLITFSMPLAQKWTSEQVEETLRHEIAHVLAYPRDRGHGAGWKRMAVKVGANPKRCWDSEERESVEAPWVGTCQTCGNQYGRHHQPVRLVSCMKCSNGRFNVRFLYTNWTYMGRPTEPRHPRYVTELAAHALQSVKVDPQPTLLVDMETLKPVAPQRKLPGGTPILIMGRGQFGGLEAVVDKPGRSRYHVTITSQSSQHSGVKVTVPFALAKEIVVEGK